VKAAPPTNPTLASTTNGIARRFSRWYSPGAMNSQTCHRTTGIAIMAPASNAMVM